MSLNKQQFTSQRTKQISILTIFVLAVVLILSVVNDNMFLDRLLPAAGIISLIVFIRNIGEQH